jgi:hypothetical protein
MHSVAQIFAWLHDVFEKIMNSYLESEQLEQEYLDSLPPEQRAEYLDLRYSLRDLD